MCVSAHYKRGLANESRVLRDEDKIFLKFWRLISNNPFLETVVYLVKMAQTFPIS